MLVSAEIRWFWAESLPEGLESWFRAGTFPPGGGSPPPRLDEYLVDPGQCELGLKKRGEKKGIEVKGLVTTSAQPVLIGPFTARIQVWTKWTSESLRLDGMITVKTYKLRWLRKFDTTRPTIRELVLDKDEALVNKEDDLPAQGCNVELTTVFLENGPKWWTLGYEAFGSIDSVNENLHRTIDHLVITNVSPLHSGFEQSYPQWLTAQLSANLRKVRT